MHFAKNVPFDIPDPVKRLLLTLKEHLLIVALQDVVPPPKKNELQFTTDELQHHRWQKNIFKKKATRTYEN